MVEEITAPPEPITPVREIPRSSGLLWTVAVILLLTVLSLAIRAYQIEARPLHSDEGVNWGFFEEIIKKRSFSYSHANYHGPTYFYVSALLMGLFGQDELVVRGSSIIFGALLVILPLYLQPYLGRGYVLITGLLVALSPSMIFHARYAIHETMFLFFSAWTALSLHSWLMTHRPRHIYTFSFALSGMVATKETFPITLAALTLAALAAGELRLQWVQILLGGTHMYRGALLFVLLTLAWFSGGFQSFDGVREAFLAVQQWVGRGVSEHGHFKPPQYYTLNVIGRSERYLVIMYGLLLPILAVMALIFPVSRLKRLTSPTFRFLAAWAFGIYFMYSLIPYKTPWLVINITYPALLLLGWVLTKALTAGRILRFSGAAALGVTLGAALVSTFLYCFRSVQFGDYYLENSILEPFAARNPYSYVHTSDGTIELVEDIEEFWRLKPDARLLIGVDAYWPLPYYLRSRADQIGYLNTRKPEDYKNEYDIMVVDKGVILPDQSWDARYYRLSDVQESFTYFRNISRPPS